MKPRLKRIDEVFGGSDKDNRMQRMIRCAVLGADSAESGFSSEMNIDATTIILVTDGRAKVDINRRQHDVQADSVVLMSASHLFRIAECSPDFRALCVAVGEDFMHEMDAVDMIYKRIRYGVKLYDRPVVALTAEEARTTGDRLRELQRAMDNTAHLYYKDVILNRLFAFYLDLSDIIDRMDGFAPSGHATRYESIVKRFVELLTARYRTEHKVDFYASQLNMSAHYLTLIVKEVTGRSVSDFIYRMLYSDARALLDDTKLSVQEITALLNFSDQSAFGKFFKRKSGLSPLDYRKRRR